MDIIQFIRNEGYQWDGEKLLNAKKKVICFFFPEVLERYITVETDDVSYLVRIHGTGITEHTLLVPVKNLQRLDFAKFSDRCFYGLDVPETECRRVVRYFFQKQLQSLSREKHMLTRLGWNQMKDGAWLYCAGNRIIGTRSSDAVAAKHLQMQFVMQKAQMSPLEVFEVCAWFVSRKNPCITILILTSFLSAVKSLCVAAGVVPHFVLYLYGSTGSFKTTLAKYFCRLYGDRNDLGGLFGELESTNAALEAMIGQGRDACVVIDDIAPCQKGSNTKEKKERAASLIRRATKGTSTDKCGGQQMKKYTYDGMLVFTAEELLDTVSTINRTILLSTDKYGVDDEILDFMNSHPDFSVAFQNYVIEWAARNPEKVVQTIRENFEMSRREIAAEFDHTSDNRLYESASILEIAWHLLVDCAKFYEYDQLADLERKIVKVIGKVYASERAIFRRMELAQKSDNFSRLLFEVINERNVKLAVDKRQFWERNSMQLTSEFIGLMHKGNLYLLDKKFLEYVWETRKIQVTKNNFRKQLEADGLLVKDKSGARTKKLCGLSFLVIDYEGLQNLYR